MYTGDVKKKIPTIHSLQYVLVPLQLISAWRTFEVYSISINIYQCCVEWHIRFWRKLSCYSRAKVSANGETLFSLVLSWRIGDFLSSLNSLKSTVCRYKFLVSSGILEDISHRYSWSQCKRNLLSSQRRSSISKPKKQVFQVRKAKCSGSFSYIDSLLKSITKKLYCPVISYQQQIKVESVSAIATDVYVK